MPIEGAIKVGAPEERGWQHATTACLGQLTSDTNILLDQSFALGDQVIGHGVRMLGGTAAVVAHNFAVLGGGVTFHGQIGRTDGSEGLRRFGEVRLSKSRTKWKFIFAVCGCRNDRGGPQPIRVAVGRWAPQSIFCQVCEQWFWDPKESPPSVVNHPTPRPVLSFRGKQP